LGIGKGLFWRRIELQASELEQYSPPTVCQSQHAGQKGCWDHHVRAGRCGNGGSYERQIGKAILGQTMRKWLMHCYHWVGHGLLWSTVVLVLAGVELTFFLVASVRLCFGFVLETVLITQGCLSYRSAVLTQSQGLFCSSSPHQRAGWGAQGVGRGHSQDS